MFNRSLPASPFGSLFQVKLFSHSPAGLARNLSTSGRQSFQTKVNEPQGNQRLVESSNADQGTWTSQPARILPSFSRRPQRLGNLKTTYSWLSSYPDNAYNLSRGSRHADSKADGKSVLTQAGRALGSLWAVSLASDGSCLMTPGAPGCARVCLPLLMRCFSPDRIPGVSMMLMLSRTGLGSWAHMNLHESKSPEERGQDSVSLLRVKQQ